MKKRANFSPAPRSRRAAQSTPAAALATATPPGEAPAGGPHGLNEEIAILRRTVRKLYLTAEEQEPEQAVRTLGVLSATAARLARLVETQAGLPQASGDDELTGALFAAIARITAEADDEPRS